MKIRSSILFLIFAVASKSLATTVSFNLQLGRVYDSAGDAIPDGGLWALVIDTNNNNIFAGFGIGESLVNEPPTTADSYFTSGQSLSLGNLINGDEIFAFGGFNGDNDFFEEGLATAIRSLDLGTADVYAGREFAFYWFPGATFTGNEADPQTIANQVGGIHGVADVGAGLAAMVAPSSGIITTGAATSYFGGSVGDADFRAVNLVPEPTTALLAAFGSLALLRRRRS